MYLSCWLLRGHSSESRVGHTLSYSLEDRRRRSEDTAPSFMASGRRYFLMVSLDTTTTSPLGCIGGNGCDDGCSVPFAFTRCLWKYDWYWVQWVSSAVPAECFSKHRYQSSLLLDDRAYI